MTLDEAITHALEVAEQNEISAITYKNCKEIKTNMYEKLTAEKVQNDCRECTAEHRHLAEWLMESKDLRAEQNDQYVFIHELMSELKEAKRLLKLAVDDMTKEADCGICLHDNDGECPIEVTACKFKWRHADEVKKLIGDKKIDNVE